MSRLQSDQALLTSLMWYLQIYIAPMKVRREISSFIRSVSLKSMEGRCCYCSYAFRNRFYLAHKSERVDREVFSIYFLRDHDLIDRNRLNASSCMFRPLFRRS